MENLDSLEGVFAEGEAVNRGLRWEIDRRAVVLDGDADAISSGARLRVENIYPREDTTARQLIDSSLYCCSRGPPVVVRYVE